MDIDICVLWIFEMKSKVCICTSFTSSTFEQKKSLCFRMHCIIKCKTVRIYLRKCSRHVKHAVCVWYELFQLLSVNYTSPNFSKFSLMRVTVFKILIIKAEIMSAYMLYSDVSELLVFKKTIPCKETCAD